MEKSMPSGIDYRFFMNMLGKCVCFDLFGISTYFKKIVIPGISKKEVDSMLAKHGKFYMLDKEDVQESYDTLQEYKIIDGLLEYPGVLTTSATTLKNRHEVLNECSFSQVTLKILHRYLTIMNKPISLVKTYGYIPQNANVAERLAEMINSGKTAQEARKLEANGTLNDLRRFFIDDFLRQKIQASEKDLQKIWHSYGRIRHRPIKTISQSIDLIRREMNFSNEKILKHGYLLYGDPENTEKILSMGTLLGVDIREVLECHPKILMSNHKSIKQIVDILREHEISETAMQKNWLIFTLGPRTVANRIAYLKEVEEFRVLLNHPRIGRLIYYQNKAIHRLNYLKDNKIFCASLNVLSSDSESFHRYAQNGIDATKGKEIVGTIAKKLNRNTKDIRKYLSRHPNWCHVPLVSISAVYEYLQQKGFTESDIYKNIHILFYPLAEIIRKSEAIEREALDFIKDINWKSLSKSQYLALILYIIEIDFHFAGDGIWATNYIQSEKSEEAQLSI